MTRVTPVRFSTHFYPIQSFFESVTRCVGYDWLFGYFCRRPVKQMLIFFVFGGFFLFNMTQAKSALYEAKTIGHLATNIILYSAASYSLIVAVVLAKYSKDFRRIVDWCGCLYTNKLDARLAHIRDGLFQKCAKLVFLVLR